MSKKVIYGSIGGWFAVVGLVVTTGLAQGVPLTLGIAALILAVGIIPPAVVFTLFGRKEPQTIAAMLRQ